MGYPSWHMDTIEGPQEITPAFDRNARSAGEDRDGLTDWVFVIGQMRACGKHRCPCTEA
jgi:hypothetical protein